MCLLVLDYSSLPSLPTASFFLASRQTTTSSLYLGVVAGAPSNQRPSPPLNFSPPRWSGEDVPSSCPSDLVRACSEVEA